jgi:hypothetical protein
MKEEFKKHLLSLFVIVELSYTSSLKGIYPKKSNKTLAHTVLPRLLARYIALN